MENNQVSKTAEDVELEIMHKGIEFSRTLKTSSESYLSGAGFGYSCGYQAAMEEYRQQPSPSVEQMAEAVRAVVEGYESDGMEGMGVRDYVFYETCKAALSSRPLPQADKVEDAVGLNNPLIKCLHDLRYGIFKDADAVNGLIDKTLSDYENSLVQQSNKTT